MMRIRSWLFMLVLLGALWPEELLWAQSCDQKVEAIQKHHRWLRLNQLFAQSEAFAQSSLENPALLSLETQVITRLEYSFTLAAHARTTIEPDRSDLLKAALEAVNPDPLKIENPVIRQLFLCHQQQLKTETLLSQLMLKRIHWIVPQPPEALYSELIQSLDIWERQESQLQQALISDSRSSTSWDWDCFPKQLIQQMLEGYQLQRIALQLEMLESYELPDSKRQQILKECSKAIGRIQRLTLLDGSPSASAIKAGQLKVVAERMQLPFQQFAEHFRMAVTSTASLPLSRYWKLQLAIASMQNHQPTAAVDLLSELLKQKPEDQQLRAYRIESLLKLGLGLQQKDPKLSQELFDQALSQLQLFPPRSYWKQWSESRLQLQQLLRSLPARYHTPVTKILQLSGEQQLELAAEQWQQLIEEAFAQQEWSLAVVLPRAANIWLQTGHYALIARLLTDDHPCWDHAARTAEIDWSFLLALEALFRQQADQRSCDRYTKGLKHHLDHFTDSEYQADARWKLAEIELASDHQLAAWSLYHQLLDQSEPQQAPDHLHASVQRLLWLTEEISQQLASQNLPSAGWRAHVLNSWGESMKVLPQLSQELQWQVKGQMLELAIEQSPRPYLLIRQLAQEYSEQPVLSETQQWLFLVASTAQQLAEGRSLKALTARLRKALDHSPQTLVGKVQQFWELKDLNDQAEQSAWNQLATSLLKRLSQQQLQSEQMVLLRAEVEVSQFNTSGAIQILKQAAQKVDSSRELREVYFQHLLDAGTTDYLDQLIDHAQQWEKQASASSAEFYQLRMWAVKGLMAKHQFAAAEKKIQQTELLTPMNASKLGDRYEELQQQWNVLKAQIKNRP